MITLNLDVNTNMVFSEIKNQELLDFKLTSTNPNETISSIDVREGNPTNYHESEYLFTIIDETGSIVNDLNNKTIPIHQFRFHELLDLYNVNENKNIHTAVKHVLNNFYDEFYDNSSHESFDGCLIELILDNNHAYYIVMATIGIYGECRPFSEYSNPEIKVHFKNGVIKSYNNFTF